PNQNAVQPRLRCYRTKTPCSKDCTAVGPDSSHCRCLLSLLVMTISVAFRVLSRNRLRSALTMLGIIIGVGAVIAMVSIGEGAKAAVQAQLATFGTNVIMILPGSMTVGGVRSGHGGAVTLTAADLDEVGKLQYVTHAGWARRDATQGGHENKD